MTMDRECPRCAVERNDRVELEERTVDAERGTVTADVCPECDGVFLDKGEVKKATGHAELDKLLTKYLGADADSPMVCPSCGDVMDAEDAAGVELDVCLSCHGVWADAGEIEALIEKDPERFLEFDADKEAELHDAKEAERGKAAKALRNTFSFLRRRR